MVPFQKIAEACKTTGLSQYYLRRGCKSGTIPHIKSGGVYYINVPVLMEKLGGKNGSSCDHKNTAYHDRGEESSMDGR